MAAFNTQRQLVYCGRIDDRFVDFSEARPEPTVYDLVAALEATSAGRERLQHARKQWDASFWTCNDLPTPHNLEICLRNVFWCGNGVVF